MKAALKRLLTPGTAIALVALFVALGGTALANHLTGANIKNNSILGVDVTGLRSGDIMDDKIQSKDIKNGTLKSEDAEAGAFETPDNRPNTTITVRTSTFSVGAGATAGQTVSCNSDEIALSGGWGNDANDADDLDATSSVLENRRDGNGWRILVTAVGADDSVTVRVDCAKVS